MPRKTKVKKHNYKYVVKIYTVRGTVWTLTYEGTQREEAEERASKISGNGYFPSKHEGIKHYYPPHAILEVQVIKEKI